MNIGEFFALIGLEFDDAADAELDNKLGATEKTLGRWATGATKLLGVAFASFFAKDLYDIFKSGLGRVLSFFNPADVFADVKSAAEGADEIAKTARALNLTTEALQRYRFVAGQSGIETTAFENAVKKTDRAVGEANRGSKEYQKTIKDLGLNYRALGKMSGEARFDAVLGALSKIDDETRRAALGAKLFEEGFPNFATLLEGGPEAIDRLKKQADDLGFIISDEDAKKTERFNDSLDRLMRIFDGLKNRALMPLIGPLTTVIEAFERFAADNADVLAMPFDAFAAVMAFAFEGIGSAVLFAGNAIVAMLRVGADLIDMLGGLQNILKLVVILSIAFGVAWLWTNSASVLVFLQRMAVELAVVAVRLVLAAESAFLFLKNLTLASAWAAIRAGFTRLIALLTTTTAKFLILALFVAGVLLVLEDLYVLFDGGESAIGKALDFDPRSQEDLNAYYDTLLLIGGVLGVILALMTGIPGLILLAAVIAAYVATNYERIWEWITSINDQLKEKLGAWYNIVKAAFPLIGVVDMIDGGFDSLLDKLAAMYNWIADSRDVLAQIARMMPGIGSAIGAFEGAEDLYARFAGEADGAAIVGASVGGGATNPNVDRAARVFETRNNRSVDFSGTQVTVEVNATDKTPAEAAEIFQQDMFDGVWRSISDALEGEEI